ncbi:kinase-like domain-containing protein [Rhizophagus clarus]|uniref:Kinase-like domain-containing protein n=1 Tax=Rhizophagus clarus TaxID=94130 RepID=A0A8H3QTP5_9GLOM|nr:kinase-like domain-containing protein [Rhizophagus clarus]
MEEQPKNLWNHAINDKKYQLHVTISTPESEDVNEKVVYIEDLEKRIKAYGICGECNEPGTGHKWCQPCNAKRFENNFKNWTSGNKIIDEFIQQSQLNAVHQSKYLEWIPFEKFRNVTYIAKGGFSKIYSAEWPEGFIWYWDIEKQTWCRYKDDKYILKSLNNSFNISSEFLNEIKSHLQIYLYDIIQCHGITQDPNTREYMMVLEYCNNGNLRKYLNESEDYIDYKTKIDKLHQIARGLLDIHNAGKIHKDIHSGLRPEISNNVPIFLANLIMKCWDAEKENRPTAKELYQILKKWNDSSELTSEIYSQIKRCDEIGRKKFKSRSIKDKSKNVQIHPQAIYTSRLLNFKNLPKPINSSNLSSLRLNSSISYDVQTTSTPILECLDVQLSELELNKQDDESNIE